MRFFDSSAHLGYGLGWDRFARPETGRALLSVADRHDRGRLGTQKTLAPQPLNLRNYHKLGISKGAYCETGWNDFLGITVGIVWNFISFSYNGSQVTGYHTWDWIRHPFPDGDYFMANRQGHMETRGTAYGWSFVIEDAPAFANTKIYWDVNEVVAHGNGRVSGYVNTWASGADKYLLGGWWQVVHG